MNPAKWLDADRNSELVQVAADMAWGALKGYYQARDSAPPHTHAGLREISEEIGFDLRDTHLKDRAGAIAVETLRRAGYTLEFGDIGSSECILSKIAMASEITNARQG
jgi:8-oxo-dGTP pyrophosphatase MutT (NUDIX family)